MSAPPALPFAQRGQNTSRDSSTNHNPIASSEEIERAIQRATLLTSGAHRGRQVTRSTSGELLRTRSRSSSISSGSEVPQTVQQHAEQQQTIQQLVNQQLTPQRTNARPFSRPPLPVATRPTPSSSSVAGPREQRRASISSPYGSTSLDIEEAPGSTSSQNAELPRTYYRRLPVRRNSQYQVDYSAQEAGPFISAPPTPRLTCSRPTTPVTALLSQFPLLGVDVPVTLTTPQTPRAAAMSYQNYLDSPQGTPGSNPRQAPPSPSQNMNQANGINGGMAMNGGGVIGHPTPAGHQSDLNYVYALVEELSSQLAINRDFTDKITEHMGKIRARALNQDLTNDELIVAAAEELNESSKNLELDNANLRKDLEKAEYDAKENMKLAIYGANILADVKDKLHKYKEQHERDTLAWHKSYRKQLADEREENLNLRNEINDKMAAAARANGHLRDLRRHLTDHPELHELRVQNIALRQERRFWKRMAMPMIPDDDSEWSDDDDLIDPEEKKRLAAKEAKEKADKEAAANEEGPSPTTA